MDIYRPHTDRFKKTKYRLMNRIKKLQPVVS